MRPIPASTLLFLLSTFARCSEVDELAEEVSDKGWIVSPARSSKGDWDLFLMRPDGSSRRNITNSPESGESYPLFSRDGKHLLYRRLPKDETIDGNDHGMQGELVLAKSNGSDAKVLGDFPWASWSSDGSEMACLDVKGITFFEVGSGKAVRKLPRNGFFQQLTWSPDGKWLSGVSNSFGTGWSVARMDAVTGESNAVSTVDNCTPDWFPDSRRMIFSNRPAEQKKDGNYGWTQLWMADADGKNPSLVYAEDGRHIYGGHVSPDGKYILFTGNPEEDGDAKNAGSPMAVMRVADAPVIGGRSEALRKLHPKAHSGPVLDLPAGWEPCWTYSELPAAPSK